MKILFGHPTGNPNSHHAALSHYESGRLAAFCVPWMPSSATLAMLKRIPGISRATDRLERRKFLPLVNAPLIQGKLGEINRLIRRRLKLQSADERLSYEANDWLMRTMAKECRRSEVSAVHSYEDCSLWQFQEAKKAGKACIYDMPIGYYPWWQEKQIDLMQRYTNWLPENAGVQQKFVRPHQKAEEMRLADLVMVPSTFVERTIKQFFPDKKTFFAPYGVDTDFWTPLPNGDTGDRWKQGQSCRVSRITSERPLRFLFAGQVGIRKGIPSLLMAWQLAELENAELHLVGTWSLSVKYKVSLPNGVTYHSPCSAIELRDYYRDADVFVFPSFFEGFGLVLLEAMACGMPAIASDATAGPDILTERTGKVFPAGDIHELAKALQWFSSNRHLLPEMSKASRRVAEECNWAFYRQRLSHAVSHL